MKIKITRANGTVIEAEGTVDECGKILAAESGVPAPTFAPILPYWYPSTWTQPLLPLPTQIPTIPSLLPLTWVFTAEGLS